MFLQTMMSYNKDLVSSELACVAGVEGEGKGKKPERELREWSF